MSNSRQIFKEKPAERFFRQNGYFVFDLLDDPGIEEIFSFYSKEFESRRAVIPQAIDLPYYISIFDEDPEHKRSVDELISSYVRPGIEELMQQYEVFYSNFMIKFPGDGQIEAHQDFNFVDESQFTAFNLWCPLVDASADNGGLFVIPGSHAVFNTQRGPNLPKALTQYNQMMKKYARLISLRKGQAIVFDHKLIHYSPPNFTKEVRVAIQSVLKPVEATALHYFFKEQSKNVHAYKIDKDFILENSLWEGNTEMLSLDHEQELIPFPEEEEVIEKLIKLKLNQADLPTGVERRVFRDDQVQKLFDRQGFVQLPLLNDPEIDQLKELFLNFSGGQVENTEYGIYISLEEEDVALKKHLINGISKIVLPKVEQYFLDCKPHLGSYLVKAPGDHSYTYPHQDWTFVNAPDYCSITIWIALMDVDESNGNLGFIRGSHSFFDKPIGSPSPEYRTSTQSHEDIFYERLEFVPLKAGEAVAFDNRTIHGATPNLTDEPRLAVAIGMTPREAQLYHYFLKPPAPKDTNEGFYQIQKLKVEQDFFHHHSVKKLKKLFVENKMPENAEVEAVIQEEFIPYTRDEILKYCEISGLQKNDRQLRFEGAGNGKSQPGPGFLRRLLNKLFSFER